MRWARLTLEINGADRPGDAHEDVFAKANMLVRLGRAIPAGKWVDELADAAIAAMNADQMKGMI